jgi:hypothetical protein
MRIAKHKPLLVPDLERLALGEFDGIVDRRLIVSAFQTETRAHGAICLEQK